ncbi:MAG TPA: cytochrome c maturation protein CcmE [Acidobacteriaceae bacterium]|jgi:cytochrome c-type biogenesis protein CcmE
MSHLKFVAAAIIILGTVAWLSLSGIEKTKQYYVTINELGAMGNKAYTRNLRVAGNVVPGSIQRVGPNASFVLIEQGKQLRVNYQGSEPPPDTFKDDAQALAIGTYGRDGVFHATQLQAKCASKYAPQKPGAAPVQPGPPPAQSEVTPPAGTSMLATAK